MSYTKNLKLSNVLNINVYTGKVNRNIDRDQRANVVENNAHQFSIQRHFFGGPLSKLANVIITKILSRLFVNESLFSTGRSGRASRFNDVAFSERTGKLHTHSAPHRIQMHNPGTVMSMWHATSCFATSTKQSAPMLSPICIKTVPVLLVFQKNTKDPSGLHAGVSMIALNLHDRLVRFDVHLNAARFIAPIAIPNWDSPSIRPTVSRRFM